MMGVFDDLINSLPTVEGWLDDVAKGLEDTLNDIDNWFEQLLD